MWVRAQVLAAHRQAARQECYRLRRQQATLLHPARPPLLTRMQTPLHSFWFAAAAVGAGVEAGSMRALMGPPQVQGSA